MIGLALLLALQAAAVTPAPVLGDIGKQQLPPTGCAAFLWSRTEKQALVAMAGAEPATLRISVDGKALDLPRSGAQGNAGFGFAQTTDYAAGGVSASLNLTLQSRSDLSAGAIVMDASLRVERAGSDMIVVPVGGLVGCSAGGVR